MSDQTNQTTQPSAEIRWKAAVQANRDRGMDAVASAKAVDAQFPALRAEYVREANEKRKARR